MVIGLKPVFTRKRASAVDYSLLATPMKGYMAVMPTNPQCHQALLSSLVENRWTC